MLFKPRQLLVPPESALHSSSFSNLVELKVKVDLVFASLSAPNVEESVGLAPRVAFPVTIVSIALRSTVNVFLVPPLCTLSSSFVS